jgi:Holliday junction resolvasome RuvABC DNA-binding subunit
MILVVKGLKGEQENVEVPEDATVLDLKAVIMSQQGHAVGCQKLLYKGKILEDAKTLAEYGVKNSETVVIMVVKPAGPTLMEQNIQALVAMGVSRHFAEELLKRCDNDLDRAKKVLIQTLNQEGDENEEFDEEQDDDDNPIIASSGTFGFLLGNEEFLSIRDILRQNPSEFEPMMAQLATGNPELYALINSNMDEFLSLVGLRRETGPRIEISQQEEADIRELCMLGFEEEDAIEAYIACDKNKELAASYLFENYQQKFD